MFGAIVESVTGYVTNFTYLALFLILLLCGVGLPVPEEVTLIAGGFVTYKEITNVWAVFGVCFAGILLGDLALFAIGRLWGRKMMMGWPFRYFFTKRRMVRILRHFRRFGRKTVFMARFVTGVRLAVFFTAGAMRQMSWSTFFLLDLLGALITVPIAVGLGLLFGGQIETAYLWASQGKRFLILLVLLLVVLFLVWRWVRPRPERSERRKAATSKGPIESCAVGTGMEGRGAA